MAAVLRLKRDDASRQLSNARSAEYQVNGDKATIPSRGMGYLACELRVPRGRDLQPPTGFLCHCNDLALRHRNVCVMQNVYRSPSTLPWREHARSVTKRLFEQNELPIQQLSSARATGVDRGLRAGRQLRDGRDRCDYLLTIAYSGNRTSGRRRTDQGRYSPPRGKKIQILVPAPIDLDVRVIMVRFVAPSHGRWTLLPRLGMALQAPRPPLSFLPTASGTWIRPSLVSTKKQTDTDAMQEKVPAECLARGERRSYNASRIASRRYEHGNAAESQQSTATRQRHQRSGFGAYADLTLHPPAPTPSRPEPSFMQVKMPRLDNSTGGRR
ncbi:hypothetical protein PMIN01_01409 [Paraphaeosphaeria minitans]|uniref:Uncharacterized protein n=1 Tax=Paraphaeosphaeria minitans TaxID=565426 RepID=A0A9P6GVJ9_9PLEO|nr:hypothetical protein PMIN01_01409 [Paraphaeosphaeria minitans]